MPEIPVNSPLGYVGVFLLLFGFFLILAGTEIVTIKQVTVKPGTKTWGFGIVLAVFGIVFLLPDISKSLPQSSAPTVTAVTVVSTSTNTPIPPNNTPALEEPNDIPTPKPPNTSTSTPKPTNTPTPNPTSTLTNTPHPTNTSHPIPTPTATIDSDPTVYDNFNNPAFDGSFNQSQWQYRHERQRQVAQQDGILIATHDPKTDATVGLTAQKYNSVTLDTLTNMTPTFWETKIMLDTNKHEGNVHINLGAKLPDGSDWFSSCLIDVNEDGANCWDTVWPWEEEHFYSTEWKSVAPGTWHTVRIELDPNTMTLTYYIDGDLFGSHVPVKAEELKNARFSLEIGSWGEIGEEVIGHFDYVRMGSVK